MCASVFTATKRFPWVLVAGYLLLVTPLCGTVLSDTGMVEFTVFENEHLRVSTSGQPVSIPAGDFTAWTVTAHSKSDAQIQGIDFYGSEENPRGFFGLMNQVKDQYGSPTVFPPICGPFCISIPNPFDPPTDSHFLVDPADVVILPFSSESEMHLRATFASADPLGTSVPFAQIVSPDDAEAMVEFRGDIAFEPASGIPAQLVTGIVGIPEPAAGLLAAVATCGVVLLRCRSARSS